MHGHGARPWGLLLPESIPRDGLRDLRRELGFPRLAQALSARQLARSWANGTEQIEPSSRISALRGEADFLTRRIRSAAADLGIVQPTRGKRRYDRNISYEDLMGTQCPLAQASIRLTEIKLRSSFKN
jgi:hypothetical protein